MAISANVLLLGWSQPSSPQGLIVAHEPLGAALDRSRAYLAGRPVLDMETIGI